MGHGSGGNGEKTKKKDMTKEERRAKKEARLNKCFRIIADWSGDADFFDKLTPEQAAALVSIGHDAKRELEAREEKARKDKARRMREELLAKEQEVARRKAEAEAAASAVRKAEEEVRKAEEEARKAKAAMMELEDPEEALSNRGVKRSANEYSDDEVDLETLMGRKAKRKAAEVEAARKAAIARKAEEISKLRDEVAILEARKKAAEAEAARKAARAEAARKASEAEAARKASEAEAARKAAQAEAARKKAAEAEAARKKAAEAEAARKKASEARKAAETAGEGWRRFSIKVVEEKYSSGPQELPPYMERLVKMYTLAMSGDTNETSHAKRALENKLLNLSTGLSMKDIQELASGKKSGEAFFRVRFDIFDERDVCVKSYFSLPVWVKVIGHNVAKLFGAACCYSSGKAGRRAATMTFYGTLSAASSAVKLYQSVFVQVWFEASRPSINTKDCTMAAMRRYRKRIDAIIKANKAAASRWGSARATFYSWTGGSDEGRSIDDLSEVLNNLDNLGEFLKTVRMTEVQLREMRKQLLENEERMSALVSVRENNLSSVKDAEGTLGLTIGKGSASTARANTSSASYRHGLAVGDALPTHGGALRG
jgi:hypothetical protein